MSFGNEERWEHESVEAAGMLKSNSAESQPENENLLLREIEYQIIDTSLGRWRRFLSRDQQLFEEFTSHVHVLGLPLIHFTRGRSPETGRRITARGVIAVGRFAFGGIAIGQVSVGLLAIGQLAIGLLLGMGQATTGALAVGQAALGYAVVAQFGLGEYVLAQIGYGTHVLDTWQRDPNVLPFFKRFLPFG